MNGVLAFIGHSLRDPKGTARRLEAMRFNRGILWSMLATVVCVSVVFTTLTVAAIPSPEGAVNPMTNMSPFMLAVLLGSVLVAMVFAFYFTGQMLGGTGRFPGALLLLTWWQAMGIVVQVIQLIAVLLIPALAGIVTLAGFAYLTVALVLAVDVMHHFNNIGKAIGTVIIAFLGTALGLAVLLSLIGVTAQGMLS